MSGPRPLYLPVESHVRELDGKILLAAAAAERGRTAVVGFQTDLRQCIASLPPGVFIAKSFIPPHRFLQANFLAMYRNLGHTVVAWDEEGLVHAGPEIYAKRRAGLSTLKQLKAIFSWGPDHTSLIKGLPYPHAVPVYETGNPRIDLLDKRVRSYFADEVENIRQEFGAFILVNSNFGRVNPIMGHNYKTNAAPVSAAKPTVDQTGNDWDDILQYRLALFHEFQRMVVALAERFPCEKIVLRPHPAERPETWRDATKDYANIQVRSDGSVVPWLQAARVMIHNGCTTAIEACLLDRPAVAYRPIRSEKLDWHLPNSISHQADDLPTLMNMLSTPLGVLPAHKMTLDTFLRSGQKALAVDEILDTLERNENMWRQEFSLLQRAGAGLHAALRSWEVKLTGRLIPGHLHSSQTQDLQFPLFQIENISNRLSGLQKATGRFGKVTVSAIGPKLFQFAPSPGPNA